MSHQNLTSPAGPHYYGSVTTEIQVTSAAIPTSPLPAYTNPFETSPKTIYIPSARRPSEPLAPAAHRMTTTATTTDHPLAGPAPNAPGILSPIHTHNYPWSREPSGFADSTNDSPATLVSSTAGTAFTSPFAAPPPRSNNFEATSHSFNATQYTSISAGMPPRQDDCGPSPTRLLTSIAKRTPTGESSEPTHTHSSKRGSDETATISNGGSGSGSKNSQSHRSQHREEQQEGGPTQGGSFFRRMSGGTRRFGARLKNMDPVKLAYLRTSFVFAISILVTWTPSSINRVYTLIYPLQASYGLNIAAAVVLPLQGVWNAVIYFTTSWKIFREEMEATRVGRRLFLWLRLSAASTRRRRATGAGGDMGPGDGRGQSGGSFALGSSVRTPRSEMGRSRRLEGESRDGDGVEGVEMQSPMSSPRTAQGPHMTRMSTMRVTQKQLDDFA